MSIQDLGAIGELLAAIATLITLVYLALQIKQNTKAVQNSVADSCLSSAQTAVSSISNSPDNAYVWAMGASNYDALSENEKVQYRLKMIELVNTSDLMYWNYRQGTLDEEIWARQETWTAGWLAHSNGLELWDTYKAFVTPAFADHVDKNIRPRVDDLENAVSFYKSVIQTDEQPS